MSKESLRVELNNLERRVKILLSEHNRLKDEMKALRSEYDQLKVQLEQKESNLVNFQNQRKISKIVETMVVGDNDSKELKEVIDDYIKEIDKCIAHLGEL